MVKKQQLELSKVGTPIKRGSHKLLSKSKPIKIAHLYPSQMNVYGDMGNIITLRYRLEARGYIVEYTAIDTALDLARLRPDIIVGGGGQDSNQEKVHKDVLRHRELFQELHDKGVVGLMVCGMYQLFGNSLLLSGGKKQEGAQVFDIETSAGDGRIIGNITAQSPYGSLVGFENHSGLTNISSSAVALGEVPEGCGNNGQDGTEGVVSNNMFGTYMHGPVLAKNPVFADELILRSLQIKYDISELEPLDDFVELQAANKATHRPR